MRGLRRRRPMELHTIGIDLGKTVFHLVGLNLRGEVVVRKKFSRKQLLHFTANRQVNLIGMEACSGSHFLGRALQEQGHEVRLIPAQYVKPYVKTNKSDYIDAEAIAEAVGRQELCPVGHPSGPFREGAARITTGYAVIQAQTEYHHFRAPTYQ